jgi:hypothetical protein
MGNNAGLIVQILAVVLILFMCFVTYMNTKTWRATHVTFLFLVFGAAIVFSVYASLILKTRTEWLKKVDALEKDLATKTGDSEKLLHGDRNLPKNTLGVRDVRHQLDLTILDRGRVWRDCIFQSAERGEIDPNTKEATVTVKLSTVPPGNVGERVEPNHMQQDTVVYAFKHQNPNEPLTAARYIYIGEFKASAVTDESITLTSASPMTELDQDLAGGGNQPWILYERMPTDSHDVFKGREAELLRQEDFSSPEAYQATLREYLRDGMTLEEMKADRQKHNEPELTPEQLQSRMFANVKFLKPYTFKVDAAEARTAAAGGAEPFDSTGQALDPRLRRGEDVSYKEGDVLEEINLYGLTDENGVVIERGAEDLQKEGIVTIEKTIYRRPLHDYAYEFAHMRARMNQIRDSLRLVNYEIGVVQAEIAAAEKNTMARQEEKTKLVADQTKLADETAKVTAYSEKLEAAYRTTRAELTRLYKENAALHSRIYAANEQLTRQIEARETAPTALEQ